MSVDLDQVVSETGQTIESLAQAGHDLFGALTELPVEWNEVDNGTQERWKEAAEQIAVQCTGQIEVEWNVLAERIAASLNGADYWSKLDECPITKATWNAIARHMVNFWTAEDDQDMSDAIGQDWKEWIRRKVSSNG